ncbi:MAG: 4-vinyl reductase [Chloroflexota bacterium]|nr:4-vinyl reductase [Chloroflexota bacterium]
MAEPCYPNRFAADWIAAMTEVMGDHGVHEMLTLAAAAPPVDTSLQRAYAFTTIGRINAALDQVYGVRGGRGMALRAGRAWFANGMRVFGALRGVADPAFRVLSVPDRCRVVLLAQADIFTHFSDQPMRLEETASDFRMITLASPFAEGITAARPVCHTLVGLLHEAMRWASNGRDLLVRESACRSTGSAACIFVVHK